MSAFISSEKINPLDDARHVLQRTGFAESVVTTVALANKGATEFLTQCLTSSAPIAPLPAPAWTRETVTTYRSLETLPDSRISEARQALRKMQRTQVEELRTWWLSNLVITDNPFGARLALFWQNHFTSAFRHVKYAELMYLQHASLIRHASGSFRDLLSAMLHDPAMLLYLDAPKNRRDKPNENLGRELLELFTLGEGAGYSQRDVREVARALTGLELNDDRQFRFSTKRHDSGNKVILGRRGAFAVDDVVDILLAQPSAAEFIVQKLWHAFVSPELPERRVLVALGALYRSSGYDTRTLMGALFAQPAFWVPETRGQLVKSPVEFVVGTCRTLGLSPDEPLVLVRGVQTMGMKLYEPPTVQGWPTGERWISAQTLLARDRFVANLLRDDAVDIDRATAGETRSTVLGATLPYNLHDSVPAKGQALKSALRSSAWNLA